MRDKQPKLPISRVAPAHTTKTAIHSEGKLELGKANGSGRDLQLGRDNGDEGDFELGRANGDAGHLRLVGRANGDAGHLRLGRKDSRRDRDIQTARMGGGSRVGTGSVSSKTSANSFSPATHDLFIWLLCQTPAQIYTHTLPVNTRYDCHSLASCLDVFTHPSAVEVGNEGRFIDAVLMDADPRSAGTEAKAAGLEPTVKPFSSN
ncbi:unnamed protein product [Leuciscus chuanchicus]